MAADSFRPSSTVRSGGDAPTHSGPITAASGTTIDAQGFLLTTDGILHVTTFGGEDVSYPLGTFALNVQHALRFVEVKDNTTASGYLFW